MTARYSLEKDEHVCKLFTLGDPMKQWRNIQGIENHSPVMKAVHINGTSYYGARAVITSNNHLLYSSEVVFMSFNFRSERCDHINAPEVAKEGTTNLSLLNYKGKLGCICCRNGVEIWVMDNAEKQEWSKTILCLPADITLKDFKLFRRSCVTLGGKIFLLKPVYFPDDPLCVYYYDPKLNSFRRIEIEATTARFHTILLVAVSDHVENTMRL